MPKQPNPMPTKLEDVATRCDHPKLYKANDNFYCAHCHEGMGNGVYEYVGLLEKELHVARGELNSLKRQIQQSNNDESLRQIHLQRLEDNLKISESSEQVLCGQLDKANQKCQLVDDEIKFYRASLGRVADLFGISQFEMIARSSHERPKETYVDILIKILTERKALSKAAKTL